MKVGLVLERFDPARGGLEQWTWQFARRLVATGHEVHVVAFDFHAGTPNDGIITHQLPMPESRLDRAALIAAELPGMNFDVVHDMGIGWAGDVIHPHGGSTKALWEHNLMRIPKWRQIRFWREKRYRELEEIEKRQHANARAKIVAVSQMVARHFESFHRLAADRIRVIYNGVDVDRFTPIHRDKYRETTRHQLGVRDEVLFLMLAHNLLLKNAETVIRATAKLATRGLRLRLVLAGGKRPDRFMKLAQKLQVAHRITFLGLVDPVPYYAAADVFVHPTWYDPCSLVTLEASACGLPVITSRFNGASELMSDGAEGFIVRDPAHVSDLAARMEQLMQSEERQKMGAGGRSMALRNTLEEQTNQFVQLYSEVITTRSQRSP